MSYSILQEPNLFQPAYNDLVFVVTSNNNSQANYNYFADLYIGGVTNPIRLKAPAHPTLGSGVFNFGRIVEAYVNSDISKTGYGFQKNENSFASYRVEFGEEYGPSSGTTQYAGLANATNKYVWNGVLDFLDFQNYSQNNYLAVDGGGTSDRTFNKAITRSIELGQYAWLYYACNDTGIYDKAYVDAYDSSGNAIRSVQVTNPFTSSGTIENHFLRVSAGPANLNLSSGTIIDVYGSGLIIPTNTSYYTVQLHGTGFSYTYRYNITEPCKYPTQRLHFLNELGAFESFNFTKLSRKKTDITRNKYKAPSGSLLTASSYGYSKSDRLDRTFFTSMKDSFVFKSDWITEDEHEWLQELITSPEIYLDDPTHGLIAVTCTVNNIDTKTVLNDKLFNLSIDLEYSFDRYRQRQ